MSVKYNMKENLSTTVSGSPGMNVLMFGFDSMSRMTWIRNLPKTYEYFTKHLDGIVLEGYNIVGKSSDSNKFKSTYFFSLFASYTDMKWFLSVN